MKPNDITLTRINLQLGMSEETFCFKANLLINGKKVAVVENNGKGEMTRFRWDKPEYSDEYGKDESAIEDVIVAHLTKVAQDKDRANAVRRVQRLLEEGVYFTKVGVADRWFGWPKLKSEHKEAARKRAMSAEGFEKFLNDVSIEEALPYFYKFE